AEAASALTAAISAADPLLPLGPVRAMEQVIGESMAQPRLLMLLVGTLAIAALLLSAIGVHGLITQVVSERIREFGIRLALGAPAIRIVRAVAQSGIALAAVGALVGIGLSFPASSLVAASVPNLSTRDPATYLGVAVVLVIVAVVSSLLPSLRIARLDPVKILRE
ncbi:MAG TPA: FtsX-like permease family protein, partial [Vicinamibacterales bacterium]